MIVYLCLNDYKKIVDECIGFEVIRGLIKCYQEIIVLENRLFRNRGYGFRFYQKFGWGQNDEVLQ